MIYNPGLLEKDDLIRSFVARQPLLERLLDDLRHEGPGSTPQHQLIIGQRGLGKTTLLLRLAFAVEDDPKLNAEWIPLVFPEEQYNVAGLADFWLNCVDALSDALERAGFRKDSKALDARLEKATAAGTNRSRGALDLLLEESGRLGRRILLLVDNLDIVFDRLKKDEEWEFRRVISEERELHFMGASSRVLEPLYDHSRAFYDFFQVHELKGFDEKETLSTLSKFAEQAGDERVAQLVRSQPGRIKALHALTGGNPRTVVLLYRVLSQGPEGDVQSDLEQLLDEYTGLYKARFEELAPQAQQVVDAMALHWNPLTAADLTEKLGPLSVNQVSAQLKRLEDIGVVEKTAWFGEKKNGYQIADRFFNIWYLMRSRRGVRCRLIWLVNFLEKWFDRGVLGEPVSDLDGFLETADRMVESGKGHAELFQLVQRARQLLPDHPKLQFLDARLQALTGNWPGAGQILENIAAKESADANASLPFFKTVVETGQVDEAIAILERTGAREWWRPIYEALRAARAGTPDQLRTVAPEIRGVAGCILQEIATGLFQKS